MNINLKKEWEKRSLYFGDTLRGVLFAAFPNSLNDRHHNWELSILKRFFPKNKKRVNVLDLGCGYGRLSCLLSKAFKNAYFYGVDVAEEYVDIYNQKLKGKGKAILADVKNLPLKTQEFDFILMVAILTYMTDEEIKSLIEKIKNIAQNDATILVIENNISGINYFTGFGLFTKIKKVMGRENKFAIKAKNFKDGEIENYFKNGFSLCEKRKCRLLTLLLPFFFLASKFNFPIFKIPPDINLPFLPTLSIAYVFKIKTD